MKKTKRKPEDWRKSIRLGRKNKENGCKNSWFKT